MDDVNDSAMLRARLEARHQESYRRVEGIRPSATAYDYCVKLFRPCPYSHA